MWSLILSITLPVLIFFSAISFFLFIWNNNRITDGAKKGTLLFRLDIENKTIKQYNRKSNFIQNKYVFNRRFSRLWIPLNELTDNFKGTPGETRFKDALIKALDRDEVSFIFTTNKVVKMFTTKFKVVINQVEDSEIHTMYISWETVTRPDEYNVNNRRLTKAQLSNNPAIHKGFIAFALDTSIPDVEKIFIKDFARVFRAKNVQMFFAKEKVLIPFFDNIQKNAERKMNKSVKILQSRGYRLGINRLTLGSAQLLSREINTPRRVNLVLDALDYLLNLSIRNSIEFVDKNNELYSKNGYKEYVESAKSFRLAVRIGDIKSNLVAIRKYETNRKLIEFIAPSIENVLPDEFSYILENIHNKIALMNSHAKIEVGNEKIIKPSLIDVDSKWLLENSASIKNKNLIYVLNFSKSINEESLENIMDLKKKMFVFGIRLTSYNEEISTLITKIKPQYIIVDKTLSVTAATSGYIKILSIKKIADHINAKIIFENPPQKIEKKWAEKIGLNYYYEF